MRRSARVCSQALSNTMWAFARLNYYSELFAAAESVAVAQLPMYSPQSIANLIWAFSATRHDAPELFDAVADRAVEIMYEVRITELQAGGVPSREYTRRTEIGAWKPRAFRSSRASKLPPAHKPTQIRSGLKGEPLARELAGSKRTCDDSLSRQTCPMTLGRAGLYSGYSLAPSVASEPVSHSNIRLGLMWHVGRDGERSSLMWG